MSSLRSLSTVPSIPKQSIDSFINEQTSTDKSIEIIKNIINELISERFELGEVLQYLNVIFTIKTGQITNDEFFDNKYTFQYNNREVIINFNTNEVMTTDIKNISADEIIEYD